MNVLSLFDGMSCGQIALERAGIKVDNYFASEIDKYAIKVAQSNYPNTKHIGSVVNVKACDLPPIDLLIGGSPCQGFSFAGKQLNFEDERSKLFFEFVRILKEVNPKYFLLENVKMKKEYQAIISEQLGVEPIEINSSLVSAQNRKRLYWTNIPGIEQPEDKGIYLKDIIEYGLVDRDKSYFVDANYFKGGNLKSYFSDSKRQLVFEKQDELKCARIVNRRLNEEGKRDDYNLDIPLKTRIELRKDNKTGCLTTVQKDNVIVFEKPHGWNMGGVKEKDKFGSLRECTSGNYAIFDDFIEIKTHKSTNGLVCVGGLNKNKRWLDDGKSLQRNFSQGERIYSTLGKSPTLSASSGGTAGVGSALITDFDLSKWRKLTPIECERLQTVPDNYTNHVSNSQRYKMLGNGWTVDIISHIFKGIK